MQESPGSMFAPLVVMLMLGRALEPALEVQPLAEIAAQSQATGPLVPTEDGLVLDVVHSAFVMLPLPGATELVAEITSPGIFTVTWLSEAGHAGPPWRYARLPRGRSQLRMNLLATEGWTPKSRPVLRIEGTGRLVLHSLSARPASSDPETARAELDRALLLMPESVGHTTINTLTPPMLSTTRRWDMPTAVAGLSALMAIGLHLARRRRPRALPQAIARASLLGGLAFGGYMMLVRLYPLLRPLHVSAETRIRRNYYFAPEVGELAALAREIVPSSARVGVLGRADDWFGPQTLCFNLWPRRCVIVHAGQSEHRGIFFLDKLTTAEIDTLVVYDAVDALPDGFKPVAGVGPSAYVARRP